MAWWYQFQQGRRALDYWNAEGAYLIRRAPHVDLLRLSELSAVGAADKTGEGAVLGRAIVERHDLSHAKGLTHARQALITDASFAWDSPVEGTPNWEYALCFREDERATTIAFDLTSGYARSQDAPAPLALGPTLIRGLRTFFGEHLPQQKVQQSRNN